MPAQDVPNGSKRRSSGSAQICGASLLPADEMICMRVSLLSCGIPLVLLMSSISTYTTLSLFDLTELFPLSNFSPAERLDNIKSCWLTPRPPTHPILFFWSFWIFKDFSDNSPFRISNLEHFQLLYGGETRGFLSSRYCPPQSPLSISFQLGALASIGCTNSTHWSSHLDSSCTPLTLPPFVILHATISLYFFSHPLSWSPIFVGPTLALLVLNYIPLKRSMPPSFCSTLHLFPPVISHRALRC